MGYEPLMNFNLLYYNIFEMRNLLEKLRRDSWTMGITLGVLVPALTFGLLYGLVYLILTVAGKPLDVLSLDLIKKLILLSIVPSVFVIRYYLLKLKFDLTGRGILLMTFLIAIGFAVLEFAF